MNLRSHARGKPCMIRVPMYCNGNQDTTVLCHDNTPGISGMGMKSPDLTGAWGCSCCHDVIDGRIKTHYTKMERRVMFLEGMVRTQYALIREGILQIARKAVA
jgi:hypothetical protein